MSLTAARSVADAVLYEGYLLYPYRSTSIKNQVRWQFGIVGPVGAAEAGIGEAATMQTECLLQTGSGQVSLDVHLRFLQVQARTVEQFVDGTDEFAPVRELRVGPASWVSWDEAVEQEIDILAVPVAQLLTGRTVPVDVPGGEEVELLHDENDDGRVRGRLVRRRQPLTALVEMSASRADGTQSLLLLKVRVQNTASLAADDTASTSRRDDAVRRSLVGTHMLLAVSGGAFVSVTDPPAEAAEAAARCDNVRCWPVLVGDEERRDVVLASPIILSDFPTVAEESAGALYDSTEIDEILTLRIMTLTAEEKDAARATDARAAAIIDRCDTMPPEVFERLHGALRSFDAAGERADLDVPLPTYGLEAQVRTHDLDAPAYDLDVPTYGEPAPWFSAEADASVTPDKDSVRIGAATVAKGSRVRLRPTRRADAQDLFLADRTAVVARVDSDVDGNTHVAVLLEDDPASDLHEAYGRYYYFGPEELEPLQPRPAHARREPTP